MIEYPKYLLDNGREIIIYDCVNISGNVYILCSYLDNIENYLYYKLEDNELSEIESSEELAYVTRLFVDKIDDFDENQKYEFYKLLESYF